MRKELSEKFLMDKMEDPAQGQGVPWSKEVCQVINDVEIRISDSIEQFNPSPPRRKRDGGNALLSADIDKLVQEECKTNSRMDQVNS